MRLLPVVMVWAIGCQGLVGDAVPIDRDGDGIPDPVLPDDPMLPADKCAPEHKVVERPISRLTRARYTQAITELLQVDDSFTASLVDDDDLQGFEHGHAMSELHAERYLDTARRIAAEATRRSDRIVSCDRGSSPESERACALETLDVIGRLAFRRTVSDAEKTDLAATYDTGREGESFESGLALAIEAILASPDFLYHVEHATAGEPGEVVPVDDVTLVSRLSFFLWNGLPDAALLDRAERGSIRTVEEIAAVAEEMIADPRSERGVRSFVRQWLALDRLPNQTKSYQVYEPFHGRVVLATQESMFRFTVDSFRSGSFRDLFTSPALYANDEMAGIYSLTAPGSEELTRIEGDPDKLSGILTHPALLAILARPDQSNPITRGLFVRERLLCQELPDPPASVNNEAPAPVEGLSTRDRFAAHTADPTCRTCHELLDPIGFGFENYDGIGRFRTDDAGVAVDARGELTLSGVADGPFEGAVELAHRLVESSEVHECFSRQLFRFAIGRRETERDECTIDEITSRFVGSELDIRELLVAIATSEAFRMTRVETTEAP
jgi:hypothetical protein